MMRLKIYKTHPDVFLPLFGTKQSACFDLAYQPFGKTEYTGYNAFNAPFTRTIHSSGDIVIMPGDRVLVPTGLIFDIPEGYSVRIHARSGLSLKKGLILANSEAVIDSDYIQETMVMLTNHSENPITINMNDRVAQAELVKSEEYVLWETFVAPVQKTDRVGGLGSTGVQTIEEYHQPRYLQDGKGTLVTELPKGQNLELEEQPVKRGRGRPKKEHIAHHQV
jgi:deoxyuridine 5'-triphosphate nucleotidohydrolase